MSESKHRSGCFAVPDCGCAPSSDGEAICYCSKHAAAPEMYEALEKIATGTLSCPDSAMTSKAALNDWMWTASQQCARAALAKADGKVTP